jgi:hypothetical protein
MYAGIHPNPGSSLTQPKTFLQFKCNGILSSKSELKNFLVNNHVKVAALQEKKLNLKSKSPKFKDFDLIHKDRLTGGRGGGLAFLIHHSVRFTDLDSSALLPPADMTLEI